MVGIFILFTFKNIVMTKIVIGLFLGACISATPIGDSKLVTTICNLLMGLR
jgi:hypothetical protein